MRKVLFALSVGVCSLLLSSCGTSMNLASNQNQTQTSVVLNQANYNVVGTTSASVKHCYVLGFGGLSKKSQRQNAIGKMMKQANLKGSQAVINVNVTEKMRFYILWWKREMKAEGHVIEFTK